MTHLVLLNVIFFIIPMCGATAFALFVYRFLRGGDAPDPPAPGGGAKTPTAGPDDLAHSA